MKTMRRRRVSAPTGLVSGDGRGLANSIGAMAGAEADEVVDKVEEMVSAGKELPANLRIEEFVAKRLEYAGVKSSHRDLVRPRRHHPFFSQREGAGLTSEDRSCASYDGRVELLYVVLCMAREEGVQL
jgi:hypothetical protein